MDELAAVLASVLLENTCWVRAAFVIEEVKMRYTSKRTAGRLSKICGSLSSIALAGILAFSVSFPAQAFGVAGKDINSALVNDGNGIRNQLVEVIVGTQEDSGEWAGYSSISYFETACKNYLNNLSGGNCVLPTTKTDSDGSYNPFYIMYSYKAEPTFRLSIGDQTLTPGVDYTVSYENQSNVTDDAKAIVTGIGDYAGSSREIAYSIVGYKTVGYYIDCDAEGNQAEDDAPYCHWQHDLTWPNMLIDYSWTTHVGGFGSPLVLNTEKNAYTAMQTVNSIRDMGNEYIATDKDPYDVHPSVTASESDSYYTAHVTETERAYSTPVDTAHIWLTDSGKEYYPNLCDWEMQSAHCWWSPKTPLDATDDSDGHWTLSDFVSSTSTHEFLEKPAGDTNYLIYKGHDGTKEEIEDLLDGFTTTVGYRAASLSVCDRNGSAIPEEDLSEYANISLSGQNDLSAYESSYVSSSFIVKSPAAVVEDNGLMDLIKGMMENGYLTKAEISYEPVTVAGQSLKLTVYNYDLRDELTGYANITDTQLGYLASTKSISTASKDAIPHGSELIVNDGHSVPASDEAIDLTSFSTLKLTGLGDTCANVADEIAFCFKTSSLAFIGNRGIQPVYLYSATSDGEFAEVSEVKDAGYYKMCLKAMQWVTSPVELTYKSGYGYCGEVTSDVFEVKTAVAGESKRSALLEAITASEQLVSEKSEVLVVNDLGSDGSVDEAVKAAALAELENGTNYICKSDSDKIDPAIKAATSVYYNADATDAEVEQATSDLTAAKAAYEGAFKTIEVDYTGLEAALANANEALAQVTANHIVAEETAVDFTEGTIWMTPEDNEAMKALIAQAESILNPEAEEGQEAAVRTASAATCESLATQLNTARSQTIRCTGQVTVTAMGELLALLDSANAKKAEIDGQVEAGTLRVCPADEGEALDKGSKYILDEAYAALGAAIEQAQALVDAYAASPSSVTDTRVIVAKGALNDAIDGCAAKVAPAKDISAAGAATITGVLSTYNPAKDETVTVAPQVQYGQAALTARTDYTATLKAAGDNTPIAAESADGPYTFKLDAGGKYTLVVTGVGNYAGSITTEFEVTYPEDPSDPDPIQPGDDEGLTLSSDVEGANVYITAKVNGQVTPAIGAVSVNTGVAYAAVETDGRVKVTCVGPGLAEIQVQVSATESETFYFMSSMAQEGAEAPETATVTDDTTGIKVSGILKEHADDDDWKLVVAPNSSRMSNVNDGIAGQKSYGIFDVSMLYKGKEMQPFGNITLSFPADGAVVDDGYKAVAYHWHNDATTPKCYEGKLVTASDGKKYIEVTVSQLSSFEPAVVAASTGTDDPSLIDPDNEGGVNTITASDIMGVYDTYAYTGSPISVNFWVTVGGKQLTPTTEFTYYFSNSNGDRIDADDIIDPGSYMLFVEGVGDYTGTASKTFQVVYGSDGQLNDPLSSNDSLGSSLSGGDAGSSGSAGGGGGTLAQTGDTLWLSVFGLLVLAGITAGVLVRLRRGDRVDRAYR